MVVHFHQHKEAEAGGWTNWRPACKILSQNQNNSKNRQKPKANKQTQMGKI